MTKVEAAEAAKVRQAAAAKKGNVATRTTSAPSAWRISTIPNLRRSDPRLHTASTGCAWKSCGKRACSRRVRCAAQTAGQRGEDAR